MYAIMVKIQLDLDCLAFKVALTQFTMMITVLMDIHVPHGVVQHMMSLMAIGKRPEHLVSLGTMILFR